jgi:hypothetical protein
MFQQVTGRRWSSGFNKAAGHVALTPSQLQSRVSVSFARGRDDLDDFEDLALELRSGRLIYLISRPPDDYGLDVLVDRGDDSGPAMEELSAALGLLPTEYTVFHA